jgi:predicted MFS family arabinose efflux permease
MPFIAVAGLAMVIAARTGALLPPMRGHIAAAAAHPPATFAGLVRNPLVVASYAMTAIVMTSGFIVIPNISAYLQENLGFAREKIPLLYLLGGAVSVVITPLAGRLVDRYGSLRVGAFGTAIVVVVLYFAFYRDLRHGPVLPWFVGFFIAMAFRNVAYNTLTSKVPDPQYRARFMSIQSAVQHAASSLGGFVSSAMLTIDAQRHLVGMPEVALVAIAISLLVPVMLAIVETGVLRRAQIAPMPRVVAR